MNIETLRKFAEGQAHARKLFAERLKEAYDALFGSDPDAKSKWVIAESVKTAERRQKNLSPIYLNAPRGRKGRRATRHLKDDCVARAIERNKMWRHRLKHMNAPRRAMENLKQIHAEAFHREVGRSVPAEPPPKSSLLAPQS